MIRLAVFGSHVGKSSSPAIHRMFARQCGLEIDYRAIEANTENFATLLQELAAMGGTGCNVTAPLKNQAWKLAQRSSNSAQRARAANTLVFEAGGGCYADNTDGRGLVQDLETNLGCELNGARVCIIGAGGAAAGILGDLLKQQPASVVVANRTIERAQNLQRIYGSDVSAISLNSLDQEEPFDVIFNASTLGHTGGLPQLPLTLFHATSLCYDLNYGAAAEPLRSFCLENAITFQDGFGMLVEQAVLSFTLWTGQKPDTAPVMSALRMG